MRIDWSGLDRYALPAFWRCHGRVKIGKSPSIFWPRDRNGYAAFCKEIGPIPSDMIKPSVGRIHHDRGYEPGNVQWEEHRLNSVKRRGTKYEGLTTPDVQLDDRTPTFRKGTPEHFEHQRKATLARWSKLGQREEMSKRMRGNQHAQKKESAQ